MNDPLTEELFWSSLEWRLGFEFKKVANASLRDIWCDGMHPTEYFLSDAQPRIQGYACLMYTVGTHWSFVLRLPRPFESLDQIEWECLLPAYDATAWLTFDPANKRIIIEPALSVHEPDQIRRLR